MKDDSEEMLAKTQFVVEATNFEIFCLWEKHCKDSLYKTEHNVHTWKQHHGYLITVGYLKKLPVNISCIWNEIDGVLVMFYEAVSRMVDHEMINEWLKENCNPKHDNGRRAKTDANNFHQVLHYIEENE